MNHAVMIIDDNEDIRENLAELLADEGYEVMTAEHGLRGLELLRSRGAPRIIILDLMMPVMDGWAFRREMLSLPEFAHVPVVILSARSDVDAEVEQLQAVAGVRKPMRINRFLELIACHC